MKITTSVERDNVVGLIATLELAGKCKRAAMLRSQLEASVRTPAKRAFKSSRTRGPRKL